LTDQEILDQYNAERPFFSAMRPVLSIARTPPGSLTLTWNAQPSTTYAVESSTNVGSGWGTVTNGLTTGSFTEALTPGATEKYYRVRIE
jgi:hypothetical protein